MSDKYKSDLAIAKHLGSSHSGLGHWISQRISAVMIILFTAWLVCFIHCVTDAPNTLQIIAIIKKPYNLVGLAAFTFTALYHGYLGLQVVIEDYIHCRALKIACLLAMQIILIITMISFVVALTYIVSL